MLEQEIAEDAKLYRFKSGRNFLRILNDIKRRPEDTARGWRISDVKR